MLQDPKQKQSFEKDPDSDLYADLGEPPGEAGCNLRSLLGQTLTAAILENSFYHDHIRIAKKNLLDVIGHSTQKQQPRFFSSVHGTCSRIYRLPGPQNKSE